jgi:DNA-directed RNA polymerase beta subunit
MIDIYIEYEDIMAPGDKLSVFSALKGVVSNVIPDNLAPYTDLHPNEKIDVCVSAIGVYKRMLLDVVKLGTEAKVIVERKRQLKEKYGQRIKDELKKMK